MPRIRGDVPARPSETVEKVDPGAFAQNAFANQVFQEIQAQSPEAPAQQREAPTQAVSVPQQQVAKSTPKPVTKPRRRRATREKPKPPIEIRIASFAWRTSALDGRAQIVATRTVRTPAGTLAQGFVIDRDEVLRFLRERGGEGAALVSWGNAGEGASAALPGVPGWGVRLDYADALGAAGLEAAQIRARFWWWFVPAAFFALVGFVTIVWVVRRAERLARERSRFAAAAAHELRTPLAGLQLYGEMLVDGLGEPGQAHRYAQRVSEEAARLGRVVGNVLGFSQLERGSLAVETSPGNLAASTRRVLERVRPALEAAGMRVEVEIPHRLSARFDDDAHARIVTNLLDNAEKYSRESSERRVSLSLREEREGAFLTVRDSGPGVPERARERIFEPFSRVLEEGDDGAAGLGLGLALARTLACDQGGDLFCADNPGQAGQGASGDEREALARQVDRVAGQRYATISRLYWHTDIETAKWLPSRAASRSLACACSVASTRTSHAPIRVCFALFSMPMKPSRTSNGARQARESG